MLSFMKDSGDETLEGYLANVALYTDLDTYDRDSDAVVMMTMHSAKGLEFPTVYLVGMEEGIFPGIRAIGESAEMEEERRLCYVAITRAKRQLYLTCARQRMLFGRTTANRASRFIDEIPEEHIDKYIPKGYSYREPSRETMFARLRQEPKQHSITAPAAKPKPAANPASSASPSIWISSAIAVPMTSVQKIMRKRSPIGSLIPSAAWMRKAWKPSSVKWFLRKVWAWRS